MGWHDFGRTLEGNRKRKRTEENNLGCLTEQKNKTKQLNSMSRIIRMSESRRIINVQ